MKQFLLFAAATLLLAACTWNVDMRGEDGDAAPAPPEPFFLEARLSYPERIALPGDAEMLVAVDAVRAEGRESLTRFAAALEGRQVPIPLGFSVAPGRPEPALFELSAAILSGERLLRLTGPVLVMPEDGRAALGEVRLQAPLETGFGQAWQCGRTHLMFGAVDAHFFLAAQGRLYSAERLPEASGVRYRAAGGMLELHEEGGDTVLLRGEENPVACRRIDALAPPLSGGGNEPGWRIEVESERISLTSDYGQTITEVPLIQTGSSGRTTRFRGLGEQGPVLAAFERAVCRDSATSMPHPYTLQVQFVDGSLAGCGGRPAELFEDKSWRLVRIDGEAVSATGEDASPFEITLLFDEGGQLSGRAACRRYTADWSLSGEGLSIGVPDGTLQHCPNAPVEHARRFLERLPGIERFDIGENGELVLIGRQGRMTAIPQGL